MAPASRSRSVPLAILPAESGWKDAITVAPNTLVIAAARPARQTGKVM